MNPKVSLVELFPRSFDRWRTLPIFGNHLDDLVHWLQDRSYSSASVRNYLNAFPKVVRWLQRKGVNTLAHLSEQELRLACDYYRSREPNVGSAVHILSRFCSERGIIAEGEPPPRAPTELELDRFAQYLCGVRGLVMSTVAVHTSRLRCFLQFVEFDQNPDCLRELEISQIEAFLHRCAKTNNRDSMQHVVATLRAYLRREHALGILPRTLHLQIDTPRVYRLERLPRDIPWNQWRHYFAQSIDPNRTDCETLLSYIWRQLTVYAVAS